MRRFLSGLAGLGLGIAAFGAGACGHCVEDKIAAVYDHGVLTQAATRKHEVVFFALAGKLVDGEATRQDLERMAANVPGIDKGSVRVSVENASLSMAYDPRASKLEAIEHDLGRRLARRGLSLGLLRVVDGSGAEVVR